MSSPSRNARIDDILTELRRQEWRLEQGGDGSTYRCFPPDPQKRMVMLSTRMASSGPNGIVEILRHLRHQGFVWPPPERKLRPVDPVVRSVPFPPQPSPHVSTATGRESEDLDPCPEPSGSMMTAAAMITLSTGSDLAYLALKEAKEYVDLAAGELRTAQGACDAAQKRLEEATTAYKDALSDLRTKKSTFDGAFSAEDPS